MGDGNILNHSKSKDGEISVVGMSPLERDKDVTLLGGFNYIGGHNYFGYACNVFIWRLPH